MTNNTAGWRQALAATVKQIELDEIRQKVAASKKLDDKQLDEAGELGKLLCLFGVTDCEVGRLHGEWGVFSDRYFFQPNHGLTRRHYAITCQVLFDPLQVEGIDAAKSIPRLCFHPSTGKIETQTLKIEMHGQFTHLYEVPFLKESRDDTDDKLFQRVLLEFAQFMQKVDEKIVQIQEHNVRIRETAALVNALVTTQGAWSDEHITTTYDMESRRWAIRLNGYNTCVFDLWMDLESQLQVFRPGDWQEWVEQYYPELSKTKEAKKDSPTDADFSFSPAGISILDS